MAEALLFGREREGGREEREKDQHYRNHYTLEILVQYILYSGN